MNTTAQRPTGGMILGTSTELAVMYDADRCAVCNRFFRSGESKRFVIANQHDAWHEIASECREAK